MADKSPDAGSRGIGFFYELAKIIVSITLPYRLLSGRVCPVNVFCRYHDYNSFTVGLHSIVSAFGSGRQHPLRVQGFAHNRIRYRGLQEFQKNHRSDPGQQKAYHYKYDEFYALGFLLNMFSVDVNNAVLSLFISAFLESIILLVTQRMSVLMFLDAASLERKDGKQEKGKTTV